MAAIYCTYCICMRNSKRWPIRCSKLGLDSMNNLKSLPKKQATAVERATAGKLGISGAFRTHFKHLIKTI